jgi:hypothetical protein
LYAFAAANLVSRKEIYNKQGLPLGENRPAPAKREAAL